MSDIEFVKAIGKRAFDGIGGGPAKAQYALNAISIACMEKAAEMHRLSKAPASGEPVAWECSGETGTKVDVVTSMAAADHYQHLGRTVRPLVYADTHPPAKVPEEAKEEPVAFMVEWDDGLVDLVEGPLPAFGEDPITVTPLFAHPPAKVPESDLIDHIDLMADEFKRIKALNPSPEIVDLCERALRVTEQNVPVLKRVEKLEKCISSLLWENSELKERLNATTPETESFQSRVQPWLLECFGAMIAGDKEERNHRFLEEALELVQSLRCTADEAHKLVDYVFSRPVGDPPQEVGGVQVTLAALCLANAMDMHQCGETELARITQPEMVEKIREKQKRKPSMSPLPGMYPDRPTPPQEQ